jgi:Zn-dependent metalloprotease
MHCQCTIIPADVLHRLAGDKTLPAPLRKDLADSARISDEIRKLRTQAGALTAVAQAIGHGHGEALAAAPKVTVYDCAHKHTLPGTPLPSPKTAQDPTAQRSFKATSSLAKFFKTVFKRNSIDDAGMTLMSSIHYGQRYNNAFWNGAQMVYGDGDGKLFLDFTGSNDVIGHELTHGITQHTLQLGYSGDAGGLNESLSDCFGSMFRQWKARQSVEQADWLIGAGLLGPTARKRGYTCLRNMANPADKQALAPQPTQYSQITPGMDPHYSSGPPNLAFCTACTTLGGRSWERIGQVWYHVLTTSGAQADMSMPAFAARCRQLAGQLYPKAPQVLAAVNKGWKTVGL